MSEGEVRRRWLKVYLSICCTAAQIAKETDQGGESSSSEEEVVEEEPEAIKQPAVRVIPTELPRAIPISSANAQPVCLCVCVCVCVR